jgi:ABC-type glycerol-3-phosphate transport system permease component
VVDSGSGRTAASGPGAGWARPPSNPAIPLTVRLDSFIGQYTVDWQHLFGASLVATIPVLILFALIERRVVGGRTAGAIR